MSSTTTTLFVCFIFSFSSSLSTVVYRYSKIYLNLVLNRGLNNSKRSGGFTICIWSDSSGIVRSFLHHIELNFIPKILYNIKVYQRKTNISSGNVSHRTTVENHGYQCNHNEWKIVLFVSFFHFREWCKV